MLKKLKILPLLLIIKFSYGWKPIIGPSSMASFSLHQSHPALGSNNHLISSEFDTDLNLNSKLNGHSILNSGEVLSSEEFDDYKGFKSNDARILTGGSIVSLNENSGFDNVCSVDKYAFDHEGTIQMRNKLPKLNQFTICYWMRFTNHSGDHTILTYSVDKEPREIQLWIANAKGSSYMSMAIHGQQVYRLNYPLKMRKWHHACTSWNGKTGEWQLWVKAERVGRGFHNRLVDHDIPEHGLLYSGGPSVTGKITEDLHFEMTLLQIYKVALSAGKAHRDHKHHHVHHFNHDGEASTTTTARPPPIAALPMNPQLANGQIPTRVRINLAQQSNKGIPSQLVAAALAPSQQATINTNFINGQFHSNSRLISQQLASLQPGEATPQQLQPISSTSIQFPSEQSSSFANQFTNPSNFQFIDDSSSERYLFKRQPNGKKRKIVKRQSAKISKRGLVMLGDGSIIDETLLGTDFTGLAQYGLQTFKQDLGKKLNIEDEIKEHDYEPAEEEVKAVLHLCTSCDPEPFKGAIVLAWRDAIISQEGTLKGRSVGGCGDF